MTYDDILCLFHCIYNNNSIALEYNYKSRVIIVYLLPVTATFIPWAIFKAEYKFVQSVGDPGYKSIPWQIETSTEYVTNELKAAQVGRQPIFSSSTTSKIR